MEAAVSGTETLFKKVEAIAKVNSEIIARIEAKKTLISVSSYYYLVKSNIGDDKFPVFTCEERSTTENALDVLERVWKTLSIKFQPVDEVFNYTCDSFRDLVRLNNQLLIVARKYAQRGDNAEMEMFKQNFEVFYNFDIFLFFNIFLDFLFFVCTKGAAGFAGPNRGGAEG